MTKYCSISGMNMLFLLNHENSKTFLNLLAARLLGFKYGSQSLIHFDPSDIPYLHFCFSGFSFNMSSDYAQIN